MPRCMICKSEYKSDIEEDIRKNIPKKELYDRYAPLLKYKAHPKSFLLVLYRHWNHRQKNNIVNSQGETIQINSLVERVRQIYGDKLNTLTPEDVPVIMARIKENFEYDDELFNDIEKQISKVLKTPKTYNLRYGKKPKRKNGKPIVFNIGTEDVTTTTSEIKQIFATNNTNVTDKLNYYKK
jgi:hypothetical protein